MGKYLIINFLIRTEVTKISSKVELIIYSKGTPSRGPSETEDSRERYRDVYGTKMWTLSSSISREINHIHMEVNTRAGVDVYGPGIM